MRFSLVLALLLLVAPGAEAATPVQVKTLPFQISAKRAHDRTLFTQGMVFHGDTLIESGGNYGESRIVARRIDSPTALRVRKIPAAWFGEGIAIHGNRLVLLTWREGVAQSFSLPALEPQERFSYRGEGWGLTSDGESLIQSNGSATLTWRDPKDFSLRRELAVTAGGKPADMLNELEWVEGWVLANVWQTDRVVAIDPVTGIVHWQLELNGLLNARERAKTDVTNGLAWHAPSRTLWVSGKLWPWMFGLRLEIPRTPAPAAGSTRAPGA